MESTYNHSIHSSVVLCNNGIALAKRVKFIPVESGIDVYVYKDGILYTPYVNRANLPKVPENTEELAKDHEYLILTNDKILGNESEILVETFDQPRGKCYSWMLVDVDNPKLKWYRKYGSSANFEKVVKQLFLIKLDTILNHKEISDIGEGIYEEFLKQIFNFTFWYESDIVELMGLNAASINKSHFYKYRVRRLLKESVNAEV